MELLFSKITQDHWTAKNELHRTILIIANEFDCRLFEAKDLDFFQQSLKQRIDEANSLHKKCKPFNLYINDHSFNVINSAKPRQKEISLYISGVFHMSIYEVKPFGQPSSL